jgi:integrase
MLADWLHGARSLAGDVMRARNRRDRRERTIPFKQLKQRKFRESPKELTGKPHDVPLSRQAVAFLHELKKQTGDGRYLFPGRKGRPISTNALEVALNSLGYRTRIAHTASGRAPQPR